MNFKRVDHSNIFPNGASIIATAAVGAGIAILLWQAPLHAADNTGETKFKEHCTACHAGGGNIIKADKTLSRKDREKHGIKTAKDIVKTMRKPGEGMTAFDKKTVSDKEANAIADYILKTFK
jgi:cytochrome c6